jgi:hypothetical protein
MPFKYKLFHETINTNNITPELQRFADTMEIALNNGWKALGGPILLGNVLCQAIIQETKTAMPVGDTTTMIRSTEH